MASLSHLVALAVLFVVGVLAQEPLLVIPSISEAIKKNAAQAGAAAFVRLWEYALEVDGQGPGPAIRVNFEAKTILAPGQLAMVNLIPQDVQNPLYGNTEELKTLRRNLLKDHLVLEPIEPNHPNMTSEGGTKALTFTGKDVHFKRNDKGELTVEKIPVRQAISLEDGTQIYILDDFLFDNRQKVRQIFRTRNAQELAKPTGPPLDILEPTDFMPSPQFGGPPGSQEFSGFAPIAPPALPPGVSPPAPPIAPGIRGAVAPPALPPGVFPPAPPVGASIRSPARPPAAPSSEIRPPAPPPFSVIRAPAPPPRGVVGPKPPAPPPSFTRISAPAPPSEGQGKVRRHA